MFVHAGIAQFEAPKTYRSSNKTEFYCQVNRDVLIWLNKKINQ